MIDHINPPAFIRSSEWQALAHELNMVYDVTLALDRRAWEEKRRLGIKLLQAKEQVGHGRWAKFVREQLKFGDRQARKYMRLAARWDELTNRNSSSDFGILSLNALLATLGEENDDDKGNPPDASDQTLPDPGSLEAEGPEPEETEPGSLGQEIRRQGVPPQHPPASNRRSRNSKWSFLVPQSTRKA